MIISKVNKLINTNNPPKSPNLLAFDIEFEKVKFQFSEHTTLYWSQLITVKKRQQITPSYHQPSSTLEFAYASDIKQIRLCLRDHITLRTHNIWLKSCK